MKVQPVVNLIEIAWHSKKVLPYSPIRVRHTRRDFILLTVMMGFKFTTSTFRHLYDIYNGRLYLDIETFYTCAVTVKNISAARTVEDYLKRKPFIFVDVEPGFNYFSTGTHGPVRKRGRVALGYKFVWNNERVTVTSFSEDGTYLVACSYKKQEPVNKNDDRVLRSPPREEVDCSHWIDKSKIKRRYKITPRELRNEARRIKE